MNYELQGQSRFAKFDQSISRMRIKNHQHTPSATRALIHCLKNGDTEAAEIIQQAQAEECEAPECEDERKTGDTYCKRCAAIRDDARATCRGAVQAGWIEDHN